MKEIRISNKVYKKEFNVKSLGYDAQAVDAFLDEINLEISDLEKEKNRLALENKRLQSEKKLCDVTINELRKENFNLKTSKTVNNNQISNFSNIDILNKIASIEELIQEINNKLEK